MTSFACSRLRHGRAPALVLAIFVAWLVAGCGGPPEPRRAAEAAAGRGGPRTFVPRPAPSDDAWLRTPPPPLPMRPLSQPVLQERRLTNGIRVLVAERHDFPSVGLAFVLDRGTCDGGAAASIFGHAFGSSPDQSRYENFNYLDFVAAPVWEYVGVDSIVLSTVVFPPLLTSAMSRLAPMFLAPGLSREDLTSAHDALAKRLDIAGSRQHRLADRLLRQSLFGKGGYGSVVDVAEIAAEPDARVREFRRAVLSPRHVSVIAVGDTTADLVVRLLERYTADLRRGDVETSSCAALPSPSLGNEIHLIDDPGAEQSHVRIGAVGTPTGHADSPALDVLASVLGAALSGRLDIKIRQEHGYSYGVRMTSTHWRAQGLVDVAASVETARTAEALKGLLSELDRAATDPFDEEETARARRSAMPGLGEHRAAWKTLVEVAAYTLPTTAIADRALGVARVTPADLTRVAGAYLAAPRRVVTVVGDAARIADALRELGLGPVVVQKR
jgi:zinc protease